MSAAGPDRQAARQTLGYLLGMSPDQSNHRKRVLSVPLTKFSSKTGHSQNHLVNVSNVSFKLNMSKFIKCKSL